MPMAATASARRPNFSVRRRFWLDHGGIFVIANIRGGAEFGEAWHEQGRLTKKQNVFDDFIACAEFLIRAKYTSPEKLAIEGRSNGGLLMGAALTQRPDLFRAVVSSRGHLRHAARRDFSQRRFQRDRVRHREREGSVPGAVRLLALSSRQGRHAIIPPCCS